jgi:hypothetical protein
VTEDLREVLDGVWGGVGHSKDEVIAGGLVPKVDGGNAERDAGGGVKGAQVGKVVVGVEQVLIPIGLESGRVALTCGGKKIVIAIEDTGFGGALNVPGYALESVATERVFGGEREHPHRRV